MLSSVKTSLNYTVDNGMPPDYYFYEPDPSVKTNPPGTDTKEVEIYDGWPKVNEFSLDKEGFELKPFPALFTHYNDEEAVKRDFYPQIVDFVARNTGAKRVVIFDHTIRKRLPADLSAQTTTQRPAVLLVHADYTEKGAIQRVRDIVPEEADDLLKGRVAFYNVWKSLYAPVEELPLAMCDVTTAPDDDLLTMELKYKERTGEIFVMRHSPKHKWYYFPKMPADQALLLKTFDTDAKRARFMSHSAFEDPTTPPGAPKRESIEVRTMAFF
ncbi:MAG: CmcJ/NvfI family oxidoreductase [Hyphomicrobium sp.]